MIHVKNLFTFMETRFPNKSLSSVKAKKKIKKSFRRSPVPENAAFSPHVCVRHVGGVGVGAASAHSVMPFVFQIDDGGGMKREATVDEVIKIVEELTRIH